MHVDFQEWYQLILPKQNRPEEDKRESELLWRGSIIFFTPKLLAYYAHTLFAYTLVNKERKDTENAAEE